ncbi:MAG: C25 family cysteine peptidase, partial [Candidatus Sumerlaeota bacterium]
NDDSFFLGGDEIFSLPLSSLGITAGQVPTAAFIHQGDVLPVGGIIGSNVWLYAPQHNTLSDQHDSLFLNTAPAVASPTMATRAPFLTLAAAGTEVALPRSLAYAPNNQYERFITQPVGERFGMHRVQNPSGSGYPSTQTQSIAIPDQLTSTTVGVTATLFGINTDPALNPDHTANIKVQGVALPTINWDGQTSVVSTTTVIFPSIPAAPATISLQHDAVAGKPNGDFQLMDGVALSWTGYPRIDATIPRAAGRITLAADGGGLPRRITLGGFPAGTLSTQILLLDVTTPTAPVQLLNPPTFTDGSGTVAIEFEAPATACVFHAQRIATLRTPPVITPVVALPSPFAVGTQLKGIYVRPSSVAAALAPLISYRGSGYLQIEPQAAYDNYGLGQESPDAIRTALQYLIENSPDRVSLPLICLVGHGTFDRRDYMNRQSGAQVPPFVFQAVATTVGTIENSDDFDYGLIAGNDLLCDAVVARLPLRTPAELTIAVNRFIAYDSALPTLRTAERRAVFAFDNDSTFQGDIVTWQNEWNTATGKASVATSLATSSTATVQLAVKNELERTGTNAGVPIKGDILAMYFGHGNFNTWAGEGIVTVGGGNPVSALNTTGQWPFVLTYTCLNHQYALPLTSLGPCLGESWITTSGKGAVVSIAPGGFDAYSVQRAVALEVFNQLKQPPGTRPRTVGLAHTLAMNAYLAQFPFRLTTIQGYTYFGDGEADWSLDGNVTGVDDALWKSAF